MYLLCTCHQVLSILHTLTDAESIRGNRDNGDDDGKEGGGGKKKKDSSAPKAAGASKKGGAKSVKSAVASKSAANKVRQTDRQSKA